LARNVCVVLFPPQKFDEAFCGVSDCVVEERALAMPPDRRINGNVVPAAQEEEVLIVGLWRSDGEDCSWLALL
jgi:hypothetical protein